MAGVRLPIRTHPLHAFVTNDYAQGFPIDPRQHRAGLLRLADRARPDAHRRRVRRAAVVLAPVVVRRAALATPTRSPACCRSCATCGSCGQWAGHLRHLGRLQPDHGRDAASTASTSRPAGAHGASRPSRRAARGWPSSSRRAAPPALIAPFTLDRFRRDHVLADAGLGGDALMLWLDCPRCGRRPLEEFSFGGERRTSPRRSRTRTSATSTRSGSSRTLTARRPSAGSTRVGCRRWLTVRRDTSVDRVLEVR